MRAPLPGAPRGSACSRPTCWCATTLATRDDISGELGRIAPALVLHGDADHAIALEQRPGHGRGPAARAWWLPGAGHAANSRTRSQNAALAQFMQLPQ